MKAVIVDSRIIDLFKSYEIEKKILNDAGVDLVVADAKSKDEYI